MSPSWSEPTDVLIFASLIVWVWWVFGVAIPMACGTLEWLLGLWSDDR